MSDFDQDSLEELLQHASPRPVPSESDAQLARAAVREEWRQVTGTRRSRRRVAQYAVAATVLLGVFAVLNVLRVPTVDVVRVATVAKGIGPVFVLGDEAELHEVDKTMQVNSGDTVVTHDGGGLALAWGNGGSLRVGGNTRIEFTDEESVFLVTGRAYFDSRADATGAGIDGGAAPQFVLRTEFGDVHHLGTQYMGEVIDDVLVVSVREGQVLVDGKFHERKIASGQQLSIAGRQQPSVLSVPRSGETWEWVNMTMPPTNVDGMTVYEFVVWVSREMGLDFEFTGNTEAIAHEAKLSGVIETGAAVALRLGLASADLDSHIEEGVIYIVDKL